MILAFVFFIVLFGNELSADESKEELFSCASVTIFEDTRLLITVPGMKKIWSDDGSFTYYSGKWKLTTEISAEQDMEISYNHRCGDQDNIVNLGAVCSILDADDDNAKLVKVLLGRLGAPVQCPIPMSLYTVMRKRNPEPELGDIFSATCDKSSNDEDIQFIVELTDKIKGSKALSVAWGMVTDPKDVLCTSR